MEKDTVKKSRNVVIKGKPKDGKVLVAKYDRSFLAEIIQAPKLKEFYSKVKNYCLSFEKVKSRSAWGAESFTSGKDNLVKMIVRGGALCVCFALSPDDYDPAEYPHKNCADLKTFENTPMLVPVRNAADFKIVRRLVADAFTTHFIYAVDFPEEVDYAAELRYESDDALVQKKLIRVSESYMKVTDADKAVAAAVEEEDAAVREMDEIWESSPKRKKKVQEPEPEPVAEPELPKEPVYVMRYDRSFISRIVQNEGAKYFYSEIKNVCAALGLKSRLSWKGESFYFGRKTYMKVKVRGKTLRLFLALDPTKFDVKRYHHKNLSEKKSYAKFPMMLKVKSNLGVKKAKRLIAFAVAERGLIEREIEKVDYTLRYPYEGTQSLLERGLIKIVRSKVTSDLFMPKSVDPLLSSDDFSLDKIGEKPEQPADEIEDVDFELADEEIEDVTFELAEDEDAEDVTFELVEEPSAEEALDFDHTGDASQYGASGEAERFVTLKKYIRGFVAKMKQGSPERKDYYAAIKSEIMGLRGVKVRESFSGETFYKGRTTLLKSRVRGKTLCLFLALNVDNYKQTIYHQQYKGDTKAYAETPMMIRVRSEQGLQRALRLIEELARTHILVQGEKQSFRSEFNYEETPALVEKGLIKTRLVSVPYYEAQELLKKQNQ